MFYGVFDVEQRERHGGGLHRVDLLDADVAIPPCDDQILLLDDALSKLAGLKPRAAEVAS